ncbi:MAG TPA: hypothetical protein VNX21_01695 [Candidatus Thermoplasmatota archaeon]|nr:hypothetical protein [Candidatus Thermoplasmatota archaeon]
MRIHLLLAIALLTTGLALPPTASAEDVTCPPDDILPYVYCMTSSVWNQVWYVYGKVISIVWRNVNDVCQLVTGGPCIFEEGDEAVLALRHPGEGAEHLLA